MSIIGVFWTRLGTPTGKSESGTVEEIEEHIKAKKPAMIYFSSQPVAPDSIDTEQYSALKNFKSSCKESGLIEEYDSLEQFKDKFSKQLQLSLNNSPFLQNIIAESVNDIEQSMATSTKLTVIKKLSENAQVLLKEAATTGDGRILKHTTFEGKFIESGNLSFGGENARESAKWENTLNELLKKDLVAPVGDKGEVFELTHAGWQLADELKG